MTTRLIHFSMPCTPPIREELPDGFEHMFDGDKAEYVSKWLVIPLNEAGVLVRAASAAEYVGDVARCIHGLDPHPEDAPRLHAMAVRSWGFAALNLGMPPDLCIGDRS